LEDLSVSAKFNENYVSRGPYRIYVREYGGEDPAIVLMHGFPDNLHLYDRLIPYLSPRRVVTFDFLGWGASDKPVGYPYTAKNQEGDLDAVVQQLHLGTAVLVAHDASGPPAINWAISHPNSTAALVLLNTYYTAMPTLRPPEAIFLFSTPIIRWIARPVSSMFGHLIFRRMYWWQVGRFFRDAQVRSQFVPLLYQQFDSMPSARPAFFRLNEDLLSTVRAGSKMVSKLKEFKRPVRIIFGDADPYLNEGVARKFHELFPESDLFLLAGARHFVQMDEPEEVARLILAVPTESSKAKARVCLEYKVEYQNPIQVKAGDRVEVGREDRTYPGWFWCRAADGCEGWVPRELLSREGSVANVTQDYSAKELAVKPGEDVQIEDVRHGWMLVRNALGQVGWIPKSHVEM
jgi:haloalkane dehalogenase